jgi:hypothetical protein
MNELGASMRSAVLCLTATLLFAVAVNAKEEKKPKISKQIQQLLAMTPEDFGTKITLKDDSLETTAMISTADGWQYKEGLLKLVNSDQFFRAFINKKTGATSYQVYQYVTYYGEGWAFFNLVNFETPNGPESKELDVISRDVTSCSAYIGCGHVEHVAFNVDETILREAATKYQPGNAQVWRFRLKAKSGAERDEGFVPAEIAALLKAVDQYKASKGLVAAVGSANP